MKKLFRGFILFALISFSSVFAVLAVEYWEAPELLTNQEGRFPVSAYSERLAVIAWQEVTPITNPNSEIARSINIHLAVKESDGTWEQRGVIAGPFAFSGRLDQQPPITSIVVDNMDRIIIAAAAGGMETEILISEDNGLNFQRHRIHMGAEEAVAPRLFVRADGGYLLFVTRGAGQYLSIFYSRSDDGISWSSFGAFAPENPMSFDFHPTHASVGNRDIVFFQSLTLEAGVVSVFQLYFKTSNNGGRTWTQARRFTTFNDPVQPQPFINNFDNQRPHLTRFGDDFFLVWERRHLTQSPNIVGVTINSNGELIGQVERINSVDASCNYPIAFIYDDQPIVVWFDNRGGNNGIIIARRGAITWENNILSAANIESSFARPIVSRNGAFIFWQTTTGNTGRIVKLAPDTTVDSPTIFAHNFTPGLVNRGEIARVSWNIPWDTSGIRGFSWSWGQDANEIPPEEVMVFNIGTTANLNLEPHATEDGEWFFNVRSHDWAGNWSEPTRVVFHRKTQPPSILTIQPPETDEHGFLLSNSFNMLWQASDDPFIAGYTWSLQFLGISAAAMYDYARISAPPPNIMGTNTFANHNNIDDGVWGFTVAAIDQAGNIGQPANIIFRTNRFIPYTNISFIDASQDEQGVLSIRLIGRGFSTNGTITRIAIQQGTSTYYTEDFIINSDREISGIIFEHISEGSYSLRIEHSTRGWHIAAPFIAAARPGTVKFGDHSHIWRSVWNIIDRGIITFNPINLLFVILGIFCLLGIIGIIKGIIGIIAEGTAIKQEAYAIISGGFMPIEKKKRIIKRGKGLAFKLVLYNSAGALLIVLMLSIPMFVMMTNTQRETLLNSLFDRSTVLLEGVVAQASTLLPTAIATEGQQGIFEINSLPIQSLAISEANYITIIGYGIGSIHTDHVWASNDPDITSKIDTVELTSGESRFNDGMVQYLEEISVELNRLAQERVGGLARSIADLTQEALAMPMVTEADLERLRYIEVAINTLRVSLTEILAQVSEEIGSYPPFFKDRIANTPDNKHIFYKPIFYHQPTDENFFRGFVLLEVSLDSIINEIYAEQIRILTTILIVAFFALAFGIIGAIVLSNLIVLSLRKLVRHIEIIRDTEDKATLAGKDIQITTKDEIATLGNTINDMTNSLVKAALAASDLSIGKEIQKKFIPLDLDNNGNKHTSGMKNTPNLTFFGYYEGAKGVSGDYFDYLDLDGRYYALIKCDVAGKGIPAALIMIQVATMFRNYFKQWKPGGKGMNIEEVVYQINDFIEELAFKGRFAAFSLCLFDSETGIVRFCNAGDNIVNYYDVSENKLKTIEFPQTPATGVLPNIIIESSGGYKVQTITIDKGDILLLFTDGIEESKRRFRNKEFKEIICTEGPVDTPHENHLSGQADEELSADRVKDIINAVMARQVYTLKKYHNPEGEMDLQFDFSTCEGSVDEVIMALVSVEKMFRCYKPENAGENARVLVDKKVDEFLKNHFLQYRRYCAYTHEYHENPSYMYYTHVMEDEQYDDLTILGIKRK